jgi:hypothetical protein
LVSVGHLRDSAQPHLSFALIFRGCSASQVGKWGRFNLFLRNVVIRAGEWLLGNDRWFSSRALLSGPGRHCLLERRCILYSFLLPRPLAHKFSFSEQLPGCDRTADKVRVCQMKQKRIPFPLLQAGNSWLNRWPTSKRTLPNSPTGIESCC